MNDLVQILEKLLEEARRPPDDLWDSEQCAAYLHMSTEHFQKHVACKPGFPPSMSPTGGRRGRLWLAEDVRKWVKRQMRAA